MRKLLLLLPLVLSSTPVAANTWHMYDGPDHWGNTHWVDMASIHTHKGITYYNAAIGKSKRTPRPGIDAFFGGNVNCKARIDRLGYYVRSREEQRQSGQPDDFGLNDRANRLFELVCPEGTISPDLDTAKQFI